MLKNVCLLFLVVALVTCQRGGKAKNKAKNMDREGARDRVENVDREAVAEKAAGKKNKFKDMFGDGKNLSKKKLLKMTSEHLPTGIHLPTGMCRKIFCLNMRFWDSSPLIPYTMVKIIQIHFRSKRSSRSLH